MKKKESNNNSRKIKATRVEAYEDSDKEMIFSFRTIPVSQAMIDRMVDELPEWPLKNPSQNSLSEFYLGKGISKANYERLRKKYPRLQEAHEIAAERLGNKIWNLSLEKKYDWNPARFLLYHTSHEYRESCEYHSKLNAEAKSKVDQDNHHKQEKEFVVIRQCGQVCSQPSKPE